MSLTIEQRRAKSLLERQIRDLMSGEIEKRRKAARDARKARSKAIGPTSAGQRKERQRDNAYLAYTRRQPCILKGIAGECEGPVEATHLRFSDAKVGRVNPGAGRKPDDKWVLPACSHHHRQQHACGNERAWWSSWGIDPSAECIRRYAVFQGAAQEIAETENS